MSSTTMNKATTELKSFADKVPPVSNSLEKISHSAGETIGEFTANIASATQDYANAGRDYVRKNPVKGAAIAAASGLVLGGLLTMALRRKH